MMTNWISVKDRLPEYDGVYYIVSSDFRKGTLHVCISKYCNYIKRFLTLDEDTTLIATHWMNLYIPKLPGTHQGDTEPLKESVDQYIKSEIVRLSEIIKDHTKC